MTPEEIAEHLRVRAARWRGFADVLRRQEPGIPWGDDNITLFQKLAEYEYSAREDERLADILSFGRELTS